jgi:hypothetical protein
VSLFDTQQECFRQRAQPQYARNGELDELIECRIDFPYFYITDSAEPEYHDQTHENAENQFMLNFHTSALFIASG